MWRKERDACSSTVVDDVCAKCKAKALTARICTTAKGYIWNKRNIGRMLADGGREVVTVQCVLCL